jgi:hypothetical protein
VLSLQRGLDFSGSGGRSWEQKSIKNRSKNEVNMGSHLGIDFSSICWILGSKLGGKTEPKSIKKGIKKVMKI